MWKLEWMSKDGQWQSHLFANKTKMEEVMDSLESAGIDTSTFRVSYV